MTATIPYRLVTADASGFDLERDLRAKLEKYCDRPFHWQRLGVNRSDSDDFALIPLEPKKSDARYKSFVRAHGTACAELDAIPPTELRGRVERAIKSHIPADAWERLQQTEVVERESFNNLLDQLKAGRKNK